VVIEGRESQLVRQDIVEHIVGFKGEVERDV
jgi:hypothetical protein